jgi:predicted ATPase
VFIHSPDSFISDIQMSEIVRNYRLSDETVSDIQIVLDTIENRIVTYVLYNENDVMRKVPISYLSDGSVKWLALVTATLTRKHGLAVEEPENFLHPKVQESFIAILRSKSEFTDYDNPIFLTTHSETLLNSLYPDEIIVVSNEAGVTKAYRPEHAPDIDRMIRETGFGLGYFYVTGAIA